MYCIMTGATVVAWGSLLNKSTLPGARNKRCALAEKLLSVYTSSVHVQNYCRKHLTTVQYRTLECLEYILFSFRIHTILNRSVGLQLCPLKVCKEICSFSVVFIH